MERFAYLVMTSERGYLGPKLYNKKTKKFNTKFDVPFGAARIFTRINDAILAAKYRRIRAPTPMIIRVKIIPDRIVKG